MNHLRKNRNILKKFGLTVLTFLLIAGGTFWQQRVLQVQAAVQVLLVSRTAIAFGDVFPGEDPAETYTVQLDTSANSATYVTTLDPLSGLQNLCPFLNLKSIDSPPEPDSLAASSLTRPGDTLDKWQVSLNVPGIKGELSQDHNGGIIVTGGDFGCKITIVTQDPTRIVIIKKTVGADGTFSFSGDLGPFNLVTHQNIASSTFAGLTPGTYQVSETAQQNWKLTSLVCSDPSGDTTVNGNSASIHVANFETVTCTFTNTKQKPGKIIICKQSVGGTGTFNYTGDLGPFNIQTQNSYDNNSYGGNKDNNKNNYNDNSGCSDNTKCDSQGKDGYGSNNYQVSNYNSGSGGSYGNGSGDKNDDGNKGNSNGCDSYGSNSKDDKGGSSQNASGSKTFENLSPGNYNLAESAQAGWDLTSLNCTDPNHNTTVNGNTAFVKLDSGETVTCTFVNTKQKKGKIIIQKKTSGGDGKFNFTGSLGNFNLQTYNYSASQTFANLSAGTYNVTESSQSDWKLYSLVCSDGTHDTTISGSTANIKISGGETVTCTFTNKKQGKIIIHKKTGGDDDSCDFSGDAGNFGLKTQGGYGTKEFDNLDSGTYNISENAKGNWAPSSVVCTNSSGTLVNKNSAKIQLGDGQTVDCTFVNAKKK